MFIELGLIGLAVIFGYCLWDQLKIEREKVAYLRKEKEEEKEKALAKRKEEETKEKARRIEYLCNWLNSSTEEAEKFYFFITYLFDTEEIYGQYACCGDEQFYAFKFSTEEKKQSVYKEFLKKQEKSDE